MLILLLRFAVRLKTVGVKGLQGDDAFALLVIAFYTIDATTVHNVCECSCDSLDKASIKLTGCLDYLSTNVEGSVIEQTRRTSTSLPESSNELTKRQPALLEGEIKQLVEGSKQQLVAWYSYASLVWCLKGTMLFFFKRMTIGLSQQHIVNWISLGCIVSYIAVFLTVSATVGYRGWAARLICIDHLWMHAVCA
jgi:hypothetical protein